MAKRSVHCFTDPRRPGVSDPGRLGDMEKNLTENPASLAKTKPELAVRGADRSARAGWAGWAGWGLVGAGGVSDLALAKSSE